MKDTSQTIPFNTNNIIACKRFMEAKIDGILIIMCRKIRLILVCLIAISSLQSQAQALYGTTGLLHAPTAEMQKDKTFMAGGNVLHLVPLQYISSNEIKYTFNYYLNITIFPWLEVGYTCTINYANHGSTYFPEQSWGKYTNQDRAFNARLRLWKEGWWKPWTPQIVLGLDDPTSHEAYGGGAIKFDEDGMQNNHFTRYYLAGNQAFQFRRGRDAGCSRCIRGLPCLLVPSLQKACRGGEFQIQPIAGRQPGSESFERLGSDGRI